MGTLAVLGYASQGLCSMQHSVRGQGLVAASIVKFAIAPRGNCVNNSRAFIEGCVAGLSASLRTYTFRDSQLANRSPRRRYLTLRLLLLLLPRRLLLERHSLQRGVPLFCYAPSPLGAVVPAVAAVGLCCCCCCCCCCCRLLTRP